MALGVEALAAFRASDDAAGRRLAVAKAPRAVRVGRRVRVEHRRAVRTDRAAGRANGAAAHDDAAARRRRHPHGHRWPVVVVVLRVRRGAVVAGDVAVRRDGTRERDRVWQVGQGGGRRRVHARECTSVHLRARRANLRVDAAQRGVELVGVERRGRVVGAVLRRFGLEHLVRALVSSSSCPLPRRYQHIHKHAPRAPPRCGPRAPSCGRSARG